MKIIKDSCPYFIIQDDTKIEQYCVMVKTERGFSQQVSPWYFRKGNAIRKYNKILQERTNKILNKESI